MNNKQIILVVSVTTLFLLLVTTALMWSVPAIEGCAWYQSFAIVGNVLSFMANIAIGVVLYNYLTTVRIDIEGVGKVKVRRSEYDIQGLTNFISARLHGGKQFDRLPVLKAFYGGSSYTLVEEAKVPVIPEKVITVGYGGRQFSIRKQSLAGKDVEHLVTVAKTVLNDGKDLDPKTVADIYMQWYGFKPEESGTAKPEK